MLLVSFRAIIIDVSCKVTIWRAVFQINETGTNMQMFLICPKVHFVLESPKRCITIFRILQTLLNILGGYTSSIIKADRPGFLGGARGAQASTGCRTN